MATREVRASAREAVEALRVLWNEWDPIGVASDSNKDEYENYLAPTLNLLERGASQDEMTEYLSYVVREYIGLGEAGVNYSQPRQFAQALQAWFHAWQQGRALSAELSQMVPRDKYDVERAEAAVAAGYPAVAPILEELIKWLQDMNWPVARVLALFLAGIGAPLEPELRKVLSSNDFAWSYSVIQQVIAASPELRQVFRADLERLASSPTGPERQEGLDQVSQEALLRG